MRATINTLKILQDGGFRYHIDDVSRDEPFVIPVRGRDFAVVPYSVTLNDIIQFEGYKFTTTEYERQLHDEFDELYEEAGNRRRMMAISTHDRVQGRPYWVRSLARFLEYALKHKGVVCLRKDEIADFAQSDPSIVRDLNAHDEWAAWEREHGDQKIQPID